MSRFFASTGSSSDSGEETVSDSGDDFVNIKEAAPQRTGLFEALSYSDESDGDAASFGASEEESGEEGSVTSQQAAPVRKSRFLMVSDSDSDEEGSFQRHVKSQKDKARDEMRSLTESIEDSMGSNEWTFVQEGYDKLIKLIYKNRGVCVPSSTYLLLPALEARLSEFAASAKLKALNASVAKAFNALRQKVRKSISEYGVEIERAEKAQDEEGDELSDGEAAGAAGAKSVEPIKVIELTPETLLKRLQEIVSSRGRKHVDKHENVVTLRKMISLSRSRRHSAHVLAALVVTNLEISSGNLGYIPVETFNLLLSDLASLQAVIKEEGESGPWVDLKPDEEEHGLPILSGVRSTMVSYAQRLDDEFTRALQSIDPHSAEYMDFLRSEPKLYTLLDQCRRVILGLSEQTDLVAQLVIRQLEHIYCKKGEIVAKLFDPTATVFDHCRYIYEHGGEKQRGRALLHHVYWLAIHDEYTKARDLLLFSHIQESLVSLDISNQILYNRTVVQIGLAAFRSGHFKETYFALQELCSTGRPKELLAQGLVGQKYTDKGEMDRAERQRLVPFHMQINVEMIDCIFLTVSMLLEIPQNAAASRRYFQGERRLYQSRHLRRILDTHDRNLFNGPPENTREYIVAAAKALANGDWRACESHMMSISVWDALPNAENIRQLIRRKVREAALYTFIYSTGSCYSTLSIEKLANEYDLPISLIVRIVTRLIGDFGVPANLTEGNEFIVWKPNCDPTPLQDAILILRDKIRALEERNNETGELINALQHSQARNLRNQGNMRDAENLTASSATLANV